MNTLPGFIILFELLLIAVSGLATYRAINASSSKRVMVLITALLFLGAALLLDILSLLSPANPGFEFSPVLLLAGAIATILAISHRRDNGKTRNESYEALVNSLDDGGLILAKQKIVFWNSLLSRSLGNTFDIAGKNPWDLWGNTVLKAFSYQELVEKMHIRHRFAFKSQLQNIEGKMLSLEIRISALDTKREEFLITIHDATREVESTQRIRENEMRLERAQKIAGLAYWHIFSNSGGREFSTDGVKHIFDIETSDLSIETLKQLIHPSDLDDVDSTLTRAITKGVVPPNWTFRIIRPDGELRHLRGQIGVLRDDDNAITDVIGVLQDITETVRSEDRLRHAQKMEAVGELTGGLSHDFNNLLHVILGNIELIQGHLEQYDLDSIEAIRRAAERGSELTQRLLAFSRKQILDPKTVNVNDCLERMLPLLKRTLGESILIEANTAKDLFKCKIDSGQLENSILNLAINAQHSMPEGGQLTISTNNTYLDESYANQQEEVSPGSYVQLSINDTGMGMPAQILDRVFEPFFTTKEVGKGSGLGLSMVYGFIKQSGGHVSIQSEIDKGTIVNLYLPISSPGVMELVEPEQVNHTRFRGKVLLVEDDVAVATLTRKFLESVGLDVVPARHADEALLQIRQHDDISLLLSDVILPGGTHGPKLAEQILKQLPDLKVVFMSGYSDVENLDQDFSDKGMTLLQKPFRKIDMIEKLQQAFAH